MDRNTSGSNSFWKQKDNHISDGELSGLDIKRDEN